MNLILVVEDEGVIRNALKRLLEREGYQVRDAGHLGDARRECAANAFDLIITDLRLPDGEGTALLEHCPDIPVLVMTSCASVRSTVDAMKRGAVDCIAKPFDHNELLILVARLLRQRRLDRENIRPRSDLGQRCPVQGMIGEGTAMKQVCAYIGKFAKTCRRLKRPSCTLTGGALAAVQAYHWPGNVRELENALERAAILADGSVITAELLSLPTATPRHDAAEHGELVDLGLDDYLHRFVLENQDQMTETELARRLGISRKSL